MGSCVSKIYDRYETYVEFCKMVNEKPKDVRDNFIENEKTLMKKYNYIRNGCWFKKLQE